MTKTDNNVQKNIKLIKIGNKALVIRRTVSFKVRK